MWQIRSDFSHVMYSVQYVTSCMNSIDFCHICAEYHLITHVWYNRSSRLHVALSANICVRNSVGFFTCDEFCRICHNCDELGLIVHICGVFDRILRVWYIQWDILRVIFSANICVRNSVGIFTCDVFCRKYHDCDEFGGNSMELLTCAIFGQMSNRWHICVE